jgi:hypothetical protein
MPWKRKKTQSLLSLDEMIVCDKLYCNAYKNGELLNVVFREEKEIKSKTMMFKNK